MFLPSCQPVIMHLCSLQQGFLHIRFATLSDRFSANLHIPWRQEPFSIYCYTPRAWGTTPYLPPKADICTFINSSVAYLSRELFFLLKHLAKMHFLIKKIPLIGLTSL